MPHAYERPSSREVQVTPVRGIDLATQEEVEVIYIDPEWFAPWVSFIDLGGVGAIQRRSITTESARFEAFQVFLQGLSSGVFITAGTYVARFLHSCEFRTYSRKEFLTQFTPIIAEHAA